MLIQRYNKYAEIPDIINYTEKIPVFATQNYADYLKSAKKHNVNWFTYSENNKIIYLVPFAVIKKMLFRKGYFVTGTITLNGYSNNEMEKRFLDNIVSYIKKNKLCDWIQQGPNWTLFNTVPNGSESVKFGTYRISLNENNEESLKKMMNRYHRKDINYAIRNKVIIKKGIENINDCLSIINKTAKAAGLHSPSKSEIERLKSFFKDELKIYVSYFNNTAQSAAIFLTNRYCTYGLYAGSINGALRGSNAYLFWEAIIDSKKNKCSYFDFVGARINPLPDSKLERIQRFKEHFGSELVQGYLWKMNISDLKFNVYSFFLKITNKKKPDIIDQELLSNNQYLKNSAKYKY